MAGNDSAHTPRLQKPSWKDPRLLIGVLLVLASVAGVVALVGNADQSVPMYAAKNPISVGQSISADSFTVVNVQLGDVDGKYLSPGLDMGEHQVALRMVPQGELVPRSSIGEVDALNRKPAPVSVTEALPKEVVPGAHVDVWVALPDESNGFKEPELMLPGVEVAAITSASSAFGSGSRTQLMVLVSDAQMPHFLGAVANKAQVSVVWNPAGAS